MWKTKKTKKLYFLFSRNASHDTYDEYVNVACYVAQLPRRKRLFDDPCCLLKMPTLSLNALWRIFASAATGPRGVSGPKHLRTVGSESDVSGKGRLGWKSGSASIPGRRSRYVLLSCLLFRVMRKQGRGMRLRLTFVPLFFKRKVMVYIFVVFLLFEYPVFRFRFAHRYSYVCVLVFLGCFFMCVDRTTIIRSGFPVRHGHCLPRMKLIAL